jgi:hypothetical protein
MAWTQPEFSREEINSAAKVVLSAAGKKDWTPVEWDDYQIALYRVHNWRGSHAYPLNTFQMNLRHTAGRFDVNSLVAQRMKRLNSIVHKLQRFGDMRLTQMQDLGGCRAIFSTVALAQDVSHYYEKVSSIKHELASKDDYIGEPKTSGYRGIHLVYRYLSDKGSKKIYNGLKIEMQLRSRYQHAWATAVETVGMFSGQALKSSLGSKDWQRFFSLMGSVIALRERCPLVTDTPTNRAQLLSELAEYAQELNVEARLNEYGRALRHLETSVQDAAFYLLELDPARGELSITGFESDEAEIAQTRYSDAEEKVRENPGSDAVLVSVDSVNALQRAYPNYFADTRVFLALMSQALSGHARPIAVPPLQAERTAAAVLKK